LQVSVSELLEKFGAEKQTEQTDAILRQEYQRLQTQLEQQRETLIQEFRQSSLQVLESWMLQWPTAAYAAQQNPSAPAVKLLPLVRPVENLLQQWGVESFAPVGSEVPYDPQFHQLIEGSAKAGETVKVRYTGYRIGSRLLFRAKVSPLPQGEPA
jgi:molecular chaperone GrpE (heat shock protein)